MTDEPQIALTIYQATKIVAAMEKAGAIEHPLPATDKEMIDKGSEILQQARRYANSGATMPVIKEILEIANPSNDEPPFEVETEAEVKDVPPEYKDAHESVKRAAEAQLEDAPKIYANPARETKPDGWGPEATWTGEDLPDLPRDFSKVSDETLRSLHAVRAAYLSRNVHNLAIEESDYEDAQILRDRAYKNIQLGFSDEKVTDRRAKASVDDKVLEWDDKVSTHHRKVKMLRANVQILEGEIKNLSREFTMRAVERGVPGQ